MTKLLNMFAFSSFLTIFASQSAAQTIDKQQAELVIREACQTMRIGTTLPDIYSQQLERDRPTWDVYVGRAGAWTVRGAVTVDGNLSALWSEWDIESHEARPHTGVSAWSDSTDVRDFVFPYVRKYATAEVWQAEPFVHLRPSVIGQNGRRGTVLIQFLRATEGFPWLDRKNAAHFILDYESKNVLSAGFSHDVALAPTFHNKILVTCEEALANASRDAHAILGWMTVPFGSNTATARLTWFIWEESKTGVYLDATTGKMVNVNPIAGGHPPAPVRPADGALPGPVTVIRTSNERQRHLNRSDPAAKPKHEPESPPLWPYGLGAAALVIVGAGAAFLARRRANGGPSRA